MDVRKMLETSFALPLPPNMTRSDCHLRIAPPKECMQPTASLHATQTDGTGCFAATSRKITPMIVPFISSCVFADLNIMIPSLLFSQSKWHFASSAGRTTLPRICRSETTFHVTNQGKAVPVNGGIWTASTTWGGAVVCSIMEHCGRIGGPYDTPGNWSVLLGGGLEDHLLWYPWRSESLILNLKDSELTPCGHKHPLTTMESEPSGLQFGLEEVQPLLDRKSSHRNLALPLLSTIPLNRGRG
ncbi:hypothetical protein ARMSODRAFT_984010 [Armillaria solidipes]|uniref:Uncharacterized protein n=1 Tax=Armillaria solidipes TaxID=1076256 RepID=A0A2H3B5B7_9AGAR|nr:hypothetical protein ARMSODRAFT_984010 [Armillaria solidipes]